MCWGWDLDRGCSPPAPAPSSGGHLPDTGAEASPLCASSQLRQRRPGAGEVWSSLYRWPLSQKQPVRKRSPRTQSSGQRREDAQRGGQGSWDHPGRAPAWLGDPGPCWASLPSPLLSWQHPTPSAPSPQPYTHLRGLLCGPKETEKKVPVKPLACAWPLVNVQRLRFYLFIFETRKALQKCTGLLLLNL